MRQYDCVVLYVLEPVVAGVVPLSLGYAVHVWSGATAKAIEFEIMTAGIQAILGAEGSKAAFQVVDIQASLQQPVPASRPRTGMPASGSSA